MEPVSTSTSSALAGALRLLSPLVGSASRKAMRLKKAKEAGESPLSIQSDKLQSGLEDAYSLVLSVPQDDTGWKRMLSVLKYKYVAPDFLKSEPIQEWLSDHKVKEGLIQLARNRIVLEGTRLEASTRSYLSEMFSEITGKNPKLAARSIVVVRAILVEAYWAEMDPGQQKIAGLIQETTQQVRSDIADLAEQFLDTHPIEINQYVEDKIAEAEARGTYDTEGMRDIASNLGSRAILGEFDILEAGRLAKILRFVIRSLWLSDSHAKELGPLLEKLTNASSGSETVAKAMCRAAQGEVSEAIKALRDRTDPEARALWFFLIDREYGSQEAVEEIGALQPPEPSNLTANGCLNYARALTSLGRWSEADEWIDLVKIEFPENTNVWLFSGVVKTGLSLPEIYRNRVFDQTHDAVPPLETANALVRIRRAKTDIRRAIELLPKEQVQERVEGLEKRHLWLELVDPETYSDTAKRISEELAHERSLDLAYYALIFNVSIDHEAVLQALRKRDRLGGLDDPELISYFFVAKEALSTSEFLEFLEGNDERISRVVSEVNLCGIKVELLCSLDRIEAAEKVLAESSDVIDAESAFTLRGMIEQSRGEDPTEALKQAHSVNPTELTIRNLIAAYEDREDWSLALGLHNELFEMLRDESTAIGLLRCMEKDSRSYVRDSLAWIDANREFLPESVSIRRVEASLLFNAGHILNARDINDEIIAGESCTTSDLILETYIAIQTGDWERFASIVDRSWIRRNEIEVSYVARLAFLAGEVYATPERALELAKSAASRASDDPHVLMFAYETCVQLGHDDQADPNWLSDALAQSDAQGPLRKADLRQMVEEVFPAAKKRQESVSEHLKTRSAPLHLAAGMVNVPLSKLLLEPIRWPVAPRLVGQKFRLPLFFDVLHPIELESSHSVGLDITTLLIAFSLDLLEPLVQLLENPIRIPAETMFVLLTERRKVRFHQPRIAERAKGITEQIQNKLLKTAPEVLQRAPIEGQVDEELLELLSCATQHQSVCVVRPRPIYKPGSLMNEEAELGELDSLVFSTIDIVNAASRSGHLSSSDKKTANSYLSAHDIPTIETPDLPDIVFLDSLAATFLYDAGVLEILASSVEIYVHDSFVQDQIALSQESRHGMELANVLDELRSYLRDLIERGKVTFNPPINNQDEVASDYQLLSLNSWLQGAKDLDCVFVDDAFVNRHPMIGEGPDTTRVGTSLHVLNYLREVLAINEDDYYAGILKLRRANFARIPLSADELEYWIQKQNELDPSQFIESPELTILRNYIASEILQEEGVGDWILRARNVRLSVIIALRNLWRKDPLSSLYVEQVSNWLLDGFFHDPSVWGPSDWDVSISKSVSVEHYVFLLSPNHFDHDSRKEDFDGWIERRVLATLSKTDADLFEEVMRVLTEKAGEHISDVLVRFGQIDDR